MNLHSLAPDGSVTSVKRCDIIEMGMIYTTFFDRPYKIVVTDQGFDQHGTRAVLQKIGRQTADAEESCKPQILLKRGFGGTVMRCLSRRCVAAIGAIWQNVI